MRELLLKKCPKCGALVKTIKDCNCKDCGIMCCNEIMKPVKSNIVDAAIEKHKPQVLIKDNKLIAEVNHVMEEDHYIEWICLLTDEKEEYVYFKPGDTPTAIFDKADKGIVYSYCNKHELWQTEIN